MLMPSESAAFYWDVYGCCARRNVINHAPTPAGLPVSQRIAERDKARHYTFHHTRFIEPTYDECRFFTIDFLDVLTQFVIFAAGKSRIGQRSEQQGIE